MIKKSEKILDFFKKNKDDHKEGEKYLKGYRYLFEKCKCHLNLMNDLRQETNDYYSGCAVKNVDFEERITKAFLMLIEGQDLINQNIVDLLEGAIKLEPNPFLIGQNTFPP